MNIGAVIIVAMALVFLTIIYVLSSRGRDITEQIIREHEEEIKRLRQKRYE